MDAEQRRDLEESGLLCSRCGRRIDGECRRCDDPGEEEDLAYERSLEEAGSSSFR